jgi:DNA-binding SARP family transcriptional activator/tetratricopeptide (TPR) repeat protein
VEFRVLGTVDACHEGEFVDLGHARQQCVLAALLVDANHPITVDQLVDRVWGDVPPQRGRRVLHGYLSRLRSVLAVSATVSIERRVGGYVLHVDEDMVDLHRFRVSAARARATDDDEHAVALFDQALRLWRGDAFAGLDTKWLAAVRSGLDAERHACRLDRTEVALRRGHHARLVPDLTALASRYPLDERLAGQLMLALYRSDRPADALRHYQRVRTALADELGVDPSPSLRQLHQQILTADSRLTGRPTTPTPVRSPVPRQLPAAPTSFTGRDHELAALTTSMAKAADENRVALCAITGTGGIGKTSLALHWAHQHIDEFPDGQLFVDLQGFSPADHPMPPTVALRAFLHALDVDPDRMPSDPHARAALFRSVVAGRRLLIVLDNAADTVPVIPLLPGSPTCAVLITSRRHLTALVARHGSHQFPIGALTDAEAHRMLVARLGAARIAVEPEAARELLAYCAGLPLALSIVAGRAHAAPEVPLADLAAELRDATTRLDALDDDDATASLPSVLSWSLRALTDVRTTVFGLLGIAPGPEISLAAAAGLAGLPTARTAEELRALERASLLDRAPSGRYRMHNLVRLHARDRAQHELSDGDRDAALRRVLDFYLHTAYAGDRQLNPFSTPPELDPPSADCQPVPLTTGTAALAWFDAEHACLLAAQQTAVTLGRRRAVWQLAWTLDTFHAMRGHRAESVAVWRTVLATVDDHTPPADRIVAHVRLGRSLARMRSDDEAVHHLHEALTLAERHEDRRNQANAHRALIVVHGQRGDHASSLRHATHALRLLHDLGDSTQEAETLNSMGWFTAQLGDYDKARVLCHTALTRHHGDDNQHGQANALDSLGYIDHHVGRYADALDHYQQALLLFRRLGDVYEVANTLTRLGHLHVALGRRENAQVVWHEAEQLYREQRRDTEAAQLRALVDDMERGSAVSRHAG